jgi:hypothetical protein
VNKVNRLVEYVVEYEQKEATIMKLTGYTLDQLIQFFAAGSTLTPPSDSSSLSLLCTFFLKKL